MSRWLIPLFALLLFTGLLYVPGFGGELIFDDRANLEPIRLWLAGDISWQQVVFGNASGPLGRPIPMASFMVNAAISGDSVLGLKVGNLILHLLSGTLLFFFLRMLTPRDRHLAPHLKWAPLIVTAVWLLHPLMVGTVLYVVQRMAILSALFMLAALLTYVHGRKEIEKGSFRSGSIWIFIGVPAFTLLAALSKENGLLAPLLCGVIEWAYFIPRAGNRRPIAARIFIGAFVALPVIGALLLLVIQPGFYFDGYTNRPFGPMERLLTQSRVLFDYLGNILLPAGSEMSLMRDDYVISTGLFTPITTVFSVAGWLALAGLAVLMRRRIPGFSAGIAIFLVGHLMESTIFPLLIYFEHRNYLPAIGTLWAVAALLAAAAPRVHAKMDHPKPIFVTGITLMLLVLSAATYSRATVWSSTETLLRQAVQAHPDSRHLRMELQRMEMSKPFPDVEAARRHARHLMNLERPSTQLIGTINLFLIDCMVDQKTDQTLIDRAFNIKPETIEADVFHAFDVLANTIRRLPCPDLRPSILATLATNAIEHSGISDDAMLAWRMRFLAAKLYYYDGNLPSAYRQALTAWESSKRHPAVGMLLAELSIHLGLHDRADELLARLDELIPQTDTEGRRALEQNRRTLNQIFLEGTGRRQAPFPNLFLDSVKDAEPES